MKKKQVLKGGLISRNAEFIPATLNSEERTVDVCWSTGATVKRMPWMGDPYNERLSMASDSVDLSRLNAGAPVLNAHSQQDLSSQIGVVERAWLSEGKGFATLRLSQREEVTPIFEDIRAGIIRNISVGYKVLRYEEESRASGESIPTLVATRWEPMELSFVPIPADAGAQVRVGENTHEIEVIRSKSMDSEQTQTLGASEEAKKPPLEADSASGKGEALARSQIDQIRENERKLVNAIHSLCDKHSVSADIRSHLVSNARSMDDVNQRVLNFIAERSEGSIVQSPYRVELGRNEVDVRREGVPNAILHRHDPSSVELSDAGRQYRGLNLLDIARLYADIPQGRFMDKREIVKRAFTTSDFPALLGETGKRKILTAYENLMSLQSFQQLVTPKSLPDFKETTDIRLSDTPQFVELPEGAEYKYGYQELTKEAWRLITYGRKMGISRQAIINDDLGAFDRLGNWGLAAARLEIFLFWSVFNANQMMGDGTPLFDVAHKNIETDAKNIGRPNLAAISSARVKMRRQQTIEAAQDTDRLTHKAGRNLGLVPKHIIVPPELEEDALKIIMPGLYPAKNEDKNPYQGYFNIIVGDELTDLNSWYMACDKTQGIDLVHMGYLDGVRQPFVEYQTDFDSDQVAVKARMDIACKAKDWKGFYKNPGKV